MKNLPENMTDEELRRLFQPEAIIELKESGEIESAKVFQSDEGKATFAFVCFKSPEGALKAKELLNGQIFNGK